mmetsp:Transcript_8521/g.21223  ORF Transcript_8521/g.21223 Transcript_8521/m.21223 type:complete len:394 (+) Transcript_8521:556-1737(+)
MSLSSVGKVATDRRAPIACIKGGHVCMSTRMPARDVASLEVHAPTTKGEVVVLVAARAITICVSGSSSCARATTELMVYAVSLLPAPAALPRSAPIRSSSAPPILPCVCLGDLLAPLAPNMLSKPAVLLVALLKSAWCRTDLDAPLAAVDSMWADWVARGVCRTRTLRNLRTARSKYAPCTSKAAAGHDTRRSAISRADRTRTLSICRNSAPLPLPLEPLTFPDLAPQPAVASTYNSSSSISSSKRSSKDVSSPARASPSHKLATDGGTLPSRFSSGSGLTYVPWKRFRAKDVRTADFMRGFQRTGSRYPRTKCSRVLKMSHKSSSKWAMTCVLGPGQGRGPILRPPRPFASLAFLGRGFPSASYPSASQNASRPVALAVSLLLICFSGTFSS